MARIAAVTNRAKRKRPPKRKKPRRVVARITKVPVVHSYYDLEPAVKFHDDTCGECESGRRKVIRISKTQDEPVIWATTFWHEFGHAMFNELGWMDDFDNEAKVEGFAHAMMAFIVDPNGRALLTNMLKHIPEKD